MLASVLVANELPLLLEQLVIFGDILHQYHKRQIDGALGVRVVRTGHSPIDRFVRPSNKRSVSLHIVRNVASGMSKRLLVEDSKRFVDRLARILNLGMDRDVFLVKMSPILWMTGGVQQLVRPRATVVHRAADLEVALESRSVKIVVRVARKVEDELVSIQKVVNFISHHQHRLAVIPHLVTDTVIGERLLEEVERCDENSFLLFESGFATEAV
mmetsp:Transcript_29887/g.89384  ORF Transcript_29887/g.89384 Transcript_29887/m.89384 type:complete len:214 (-) Transcript_29887:4350-4991(-)